MPILHLIPVGVSLLKQIDDGNLPLLTSALADGELPGSADTVWEALSKATGPRHELDLDRLKLTGTPRATVASDPSMAAEWTSVRAVRDDADYSAAGGRAYVLIATDSDRGLRAATLVAMRYRHTTVRYLHEPLQAGPLAADPGDVYICRIPDLDLGEREPTSVTWRSLGAVGRMVVDTVTQTGHGEWDVVVHLSGGYKAMIPYLMVLAEGVHSRLRNEPLGPGRRPKIHAVAIHDPSDGTNPNQARNVIDIPVRAFDGDLLADVRKLAALTQPDTDDVGPDAPVDLRGLFIDRKNGRPYHLTSAGLIMVKVL
ncbi:MAG: hypothetical protein ACRDS0_11690 [Pseudonocardiaceae bacterium]